MILVLFYNVYRLKKAENVIQTYFLIYIYYLITFSIVLSSDILLYFNTLSRYFKNLIKRVEIYKNQFSVYTLFSMSTILSYVLPTQALFTQHIVVSTVR